MKNFLFELGFISEDVEIIIDAQNRLNKYTDDVKNALCYYMSDQMQAWYFITSNLSENTKLNLYTVYLSLLLKKAYKTKDEYIKKGLSYQLFIDTMRDFSFKNNECKKVYGVVGTFAELWFRRFFLLERFMFNRLQVEKTDFEYDEYKHLKKGDTVYKLHIPSNGPLFIEDVITSLKLAYDFYKNDHKGDIMPFVCNSWLLFPAFKKLFSPHGNISKFRKLFTIIHSNTYEDFHNSWRIFNEPYNGKIDHLPENTSLQRAMKKYYLDGNLEGVGYGILFFDGNKVIV